MAKKATGKIVSFDDMLQAKLDGKFEEAQRKAGLIGGTESSADILSTGLMMIDIILGGGIRPGGWYTNFGPEQSAKSTLAMQIMISALLAETRNIHYWDYEGSSGNSDYLVGQMKTNGLKMTPTQIFGVRDQKGKLIQRGAVTYQPATILEDFFDVEHKFLKNLPDKSFINGRWWYIFDDDKHGKEMTAGKHNMDIKRQYGKLALPATNGSLQALIIVDSYPAMNPRSMDEDDPKSGMAAQARAFAQEIRRVRGRLKQKRVSVIGINQLRLRPGFNMGNPEYEPCGEALKFNSDVRMALRSRVPPVKNANVKGRVEVEEAVGGGDDAYTYIHARTQKNKLSTSVFECWQRIWIKDSKAEGRGFDPVFDTYQYLSETNQIEGKKNKLKILHERFKKMRPLTWMEFKTLITGTKEQIHKVQRDAKIIGKSDKPFKTRELFRRQLASGNGMELFLQAKASESSDDDDEGDDD